MILVHFLSLPHSPDHPDDKPSPCVVTLVFRARPRVLFYFTSSHHLPAWGDNQSHRSPSTRLPTAHPPLLLTVIFSSRHYFVFRARLTRSRTSSRIARTHTHTLSLSLSRPGSRGANPLLLPLAPSHSPRERGHALDDRPPLELTAWAFRLRYTIHTFPRSSVCIFGLMSISNLWKASLSDSRFIPNSLFPQSWQRS